MSAPRKSLQRHLVRVLTVALATLYGLGAISIYAFMRFSLLEQMDTHLIRVAKDFIAETKRTPDGGVESGFHHLKLDDFAESNSAGGAFYELRDASGKSIVRSESLAAEMDLPFREVEPSHFEIEKISFPGDFPARVVFASFPLELKPEGENSEAETAFAANYDSNAPANRAFLTLAEDTLSLRKTLFILGTTLAITGLSLMFATYLLVRRIVHHAVHPIVEVAALTEQLGPSDLGTRLPVDRVPAEVQPLISKFNDFIERLEEAIQRERRFSIDIAHELRTPLAEMRTLMEIANRTDPNDPDLPAEMAPLEIYRLGAMISERMSKLTETLTSIHQTDADKIEIKEEPVEIDSLLTAAINTLDSDVRERIRLSSELDSPAMIRSDGALIRAIIDNLLLNAVVHSPDGSEVIVTPCVDGFRIANHTVNLGEGDLAVMDEPFWQKDASRTAADRFGLGLSLVNLYLQLLDGKIEHRLNEQVIQTIVSFPHRS